MSLQKRRILFHGLHSLLVLSRNLCLARQCLRLRVHDGLSLKDWIAGLIEIGIEFGRVLKFRLLNYDRWQHTRGIDMNHRHGLSAGTNRRSQFTLSEFPTLRTSPPFHGHIFSRLTSLQSIKGTKLGKHRIPPRRLVQQNITTLSILQSLYRE